MSEVLRQVHVCVLCFVDGGDEDVLGQKLL